MLYIKPSKSHSNQIKSEDRQNEEEVKHVKNRSISDSSHNEVQQQLVDLNDNKKPYHIQGYEQHQVRNDA